MSFWVGAYLPSVLQLLTNVDEKKLGALRAALNDVIEPELDYDKSYIEDALHWRPAANGHTAPPHTNEKVETPSGALLQNPFEPLGSSHIVCNSAAKHFCGKCLSPRS